MVLDPVSIPKFLFVWLPALAITVSLPEAGVPLGDRFLVEVAGLPIPVVTCALGALGIIAARPFTIQAEQDLGWKLRLLVTLIVLVLVQLWIIESRPGWLLAFVVAIGLGFSGFSLLELFGDQVKDLMRRAFEVAGNSIGKGPTDT